MRLDSENGRFRGHWRIRAVVLSAVLVKGNMDAGIRLFGWKLGIW